MSYCLLLLLSILPWARLVLQGDHPVDTEHLPHFSHLVNRRKLYYTCPQCRLYLNPIVVKKQFCLLMSICHCLPFNSDGYYFLIGIIRSLTENLQESLFPKQEVIATFCWIPVYIWWKEHLGCNPWKGMSLFCGKLDTFKPLGGERLLFWPSPV